MSDAMGSERALVKYADGLVEELRDKAPAALRDFDAGAIHDARVATRRLSATLDLLEPVLSSGPRKKVERVLKKLRRRLGSMRDLDVMIEHLRELADRPAAAAAPGEPAMAEADAPPARPQDAAIAWLIAQLEEERSAARKKSSRKKSPARVMESLGAWWGLHAELAEAEEAAGALLAESIHLQLDSFSERAVADKTDRADPHALRKAGKSLRYTLELADETGHELPPRAISTFKKMQDSLGLWHDFAVLADTAMHASTAAMLTYHDPALQLRVLELTQFVVRRSRRALARFDRLWRRRGEELAAGIRRAFPLTHDGADAGDQAAPTAAEQVEQQTAGEPPAASDPAPSEPAPSAPQ